MLPGHQWSGTNQRNMLLREDLIRDYISLSIRHSPQLVKADHRGLVFRAGDAVSGSIIAQSALCPPNSVGIAFDRGLI